MDRPETLRLLRASHDEITTLRRRVADLEPRAHAYDTIAQAMRLSIPREGGYAQVDIAWELKNAVGEIEADRQKERDAAAPRPVRARRKPGPKPKAKAKPAA